MVWLKCQQPYHC